MHPPEPRGVISPDELAIRTLIDTWHRATAAGDVATVLGLMAEDVVLYVVGHEPMCGRETFGKILRAILLSHHFESQGEITELVVVGDLAYCSTLLNVRVIPRSDSNGVTRQGYSMSIVRKQADGRWPLVRDANLLAPVE